MSYGRNPLRHDLGGRPKKPPQPDPGAPARSLTVLEWYCKRCRVYRNEEEGGERCIECLAPMTATKVQTRKGEIWPEQS